MPKFLNDTGLSHLISKIKTLLNGKVDKVTGKALSTNDFTNEYKSRVDNTVSCVDDLKMLGWSVPAHMGIKNTITPQGLFQQNVGRIKIKTHTWNATAAGIFYASLTERSFGSGNFNVTSNNYPTHTNSHSTASNIASLVAQYGDGIYINAGSNTIFIADSRYSTNTQFLAAAGDEYLYCELATKPAAIYIDGNEATLPQGIDDASGLNLTSSYGTISNVHMVRIGKLCTIVCQMSITSAISVGGNLLSGIPTAVVTTPAIVKDGAWNHKQAMIIGGVIRLNEALNSGTMYINITYITT